jgi:ribulose-phosphate 3-epimerase
MVITPALLCENFEQINYDLFVLEGVTKRVQIDLCDGVFGLEKTWLPYEEIELPAGFLYEFDLMVVDWRKYLRRVLVLGAVRVVMHIDTMGEAEFVEMIQMVQASGCFLGLSVSNTYDVGAFAVRINQATAMYSKVFVQVMGINHIGIQGQPFDERAISHIKDIVRSCKNIEIQVDGSMNPETISLVKNAGAKCVVVGSYLFKEGDAKKKFDTLERLFT